MISVTLARQAMATRFELVAFGEDAPALQAAGEEALDEIERWEAHLSLYRASSAVAELNRRAHREPVRVDPRLFELLQQAQRLHAESGGAFDITVGPLMRCWGFMGGPGRPPTPEALAEARARVGMRLVELNPADFTVRFRREGVLLDLGAIGKGYAVEQAMELLAEAGVTRALLHGGTSSIATLGAPPGADAWNVGIEMPATPGTASPAPAAGPVRGGERAFTLRPNPAAAAPDRAPGELLAIVPLRDASLSVSAVQGKYFESAGQRYGHVIDPRTGQPAGGAVLAAVVVPSATEADALSTALLTLGGGGWAGVCQNRPGMRSLVVEPEGVERSLRVRRFGLELRNS